MDEAEERFVKPFYLQMMNLNALANADCVPRVRQAGREVAAATVVTFLRGAWRPRVMGAWYALLHDTPEIRTAVLRSLETSAGALTAPALATAAVVLAGVEAMTSLGLYAATDVSREYGAAGFIAAAVEHVGGAPAFASATNRDRDHFTGMLAVAERLRAG